MLQLRSSVLILPYYCSNFKFSGIFLLYPMEDTIEDTTKDKKAGKYKDVTYGHPIWGFSNLIRARCRV